MNTQYSLEDAPDAPFLDQVWTNVKGRVIQEINRQAYDKFVGSTKLVSFENGVAVLSTPGRFVQVWIRDKYADRLREMLSDELGQEVRLEVECHATPKPTVEIGANAPVGITSTAVQESRFIPNEKFSFDSFVVGQSNRLAFAGAKAVAAEPGKLYNPLFIYSPSGMGKTHLLHSIAREVLKRDPNFNLVYITAQQFAEDFINALQQGRVEMFRRSHRNVGMWLVDDIQFIAGKDRTSEEIFHTFNHLYGLGKQIVLCSDRPPRTLHLMAERLRSRFESGLVADIQYPDTETRCAILQSKAQIDRLELSHDVAMLLAEKVPGNVRRLEGALTKVVAEASLCGVPLTREFASEVVERHFGNELREKASVKQIIEMVGRHYKIGSEDIFGASRKAPIVQARHVSIYITRELTGDSWKHIGTMFGDRDHTSMMHGYQKVSELMQEDADLRATVQTLMRTLGQEA